PAAVDGAAGAPGPARHHRTAAGQPGAAADRAQLPLADRRSDGALLPDHPAGRLLLRSVRRRARPAAAAQRLAWPRRRAPDEAAPGRGGARVRRPAGARCQPAGGAAGGREPGAGAEAVAAAAVRGLPPRTPGPLTRHGSRHGPPKKLVLHPTEGREAHGRPGSIVVLEATKRGRPWPKYIGR